MHACNIGRFREVEGADIHASCVMHEDDVMYECMLDANLAYSAYMHTCVHACTAGCMYACMYSTCRAGSSKHCERVGMRDVRCIGERKLMGEQKGLRCFLSFAITL